MNLFHKRIVFCPYRAFVAVCNPVVVIIEAWKGCSFFFDSRNLTDFKSLHEKNCHQSNAELCGDSGAEKIGVIVSDFTTVQGLSISEVFVRRFDYVGRVEHLSGFCWNFQWFLKNCPLNRFVACRRRQWSRISNFYKKLFR